MNSELQTSMDSSANTRATDSDTEFEDKLSPLFKPPPLMMHGHIDLHFQANTQGNIRGMAATQSQSQSSDSAYGSNAPVSYQEGMNGKSLAISPIASSSSDSREWHMDEAGFGAESLCNKEFEDFENNILKETSSPIEWPVFDDAVIGGFPASNVSDDINFFNFDGPLSGLLEP